MQPLLEARNLTKRFHQVVANDDISFDIMPGEIHCLLGENGAGKSTLAECIYGFYQPDAGEFILDGHRVEIRSPSDAIRNGIGMVHQHFVLVPTLSVLENIVVGTEGTGIVLDLRKARETLRGISERYGVSIDLDAKVWQLSVGEQQWVEIVKALYLGARLLIMDEPTAVLTPQESQRLFGIFRSMTASGMSVVLISHKLNEVMQSDRVTILRKGRKIATAVTAQSSKAELTNMMVGRELKAVARVDDQEPGAVVLSAQDLRAKGERGQNALDGLGLELRRGEIVGVAGVAGNGQKELFEVLMGARKVFAGTVTLDGTDITNRSPALISASGVGYIPDDRFKEGLVPAFNITDNLILGAQRTGRFAKRGFLRLAKAREFARQAIEQFHIATPSENTRTGTLSGGNAQKVIVAREFSQATKVILANQPSRGLDVGVIEYMMEQLLAKRKAGFGILVASEELNELASIADRVVVMFKGKIVGSFRSGEIDLERIGLLMAGHDA
jgi:simple sugar transport system ATP-binding protein